jgi:hypothetical protein
MKFSLGGDHGLDVLTPGYPKSQQIACNSPAEVPGDATADSARPQRLKYRPRRDRYVFLWKTKRAWAGTCRQFVLGLDDGSGHRANFHFRR